MILLNNNELKKINGGSLSGTLINAIVRGVSFIFDLGRALGSAILRLNRKKICNI
jgi:bacteriocin-like protein